MTPEFNRVPEMTMQQPLVQMQHPLVQMQHNLLPTLTSQYEQSHHVNKCCCYCCARATPSDGCMEAAVAAANFTATASDPYFPVLLQLPLSKVCTSTAKRLPLQLSFHYFSCYSFHCHTSCSCHYSCTTIHPTEPAAATAA